MAVSTMWISQDPYEILASPDLDVYSTVGATSHNSSGAKNTVKSGKSSHPFRLAAVGLGLLCAILLTATIALCVLYMRERGLKMLNAQNCKDRLQGNCTSLSNEKAKLHRDYSRLSNEKNQLQENCTRLSNETNQLQGDYNNLRNEKAKLQGEYSRLSNEKNQQQENCTKLSNETNQLQNRLSNERNKIEGDYNNLLNEKTKLQGDNNRLSNEKNQLQGDNDNLRNEKTKLQGDNNRLSNEKNQLQGDYDNLGDEKTKLQGDNNRLSNEKNQLQGDYDNLRNEKAKLQEDYNNIRNEKDQLQRDCNSQNGQCSTCPKGWKQLSSKCYFFSEEWKNWEDSRKFCKHKGAELVIINSEQEQEFINRHATDRHYWIGLKDSANGLFEWVDGTALQQAFWSRGSPDENRKWGLHCVITSPGENLWLDVPCLTSRSLICEACVCNRKLSK